MIAVVNRVLGRRAHGFLVALTAAALGCGDVKLEPDAGIDLDIDARIDAAADASDCADPPCPECEAGETSCQSLVLSVCNDEGVFETTECPLGCHPSGQRCYGMEPSNGLGALFDSAVGFDDLVLNAVTVDSDSGEIRDAGDAPVPVSSVLVAQSGGASIRAVLAGELVLGDVRVTGALPIAFVATGDVEVRGRVSVAAAANAPGPGAQPDSCGSGDIVATPVSIVPGGGGGGFGATGGAGGAAQSAAGGPPVAVNGNPQLSPLRGGCRGGHVLGSADPFPVWAEGGGGGGAIQIVSLTAIRVVADAAGGDTGVIAAGGGGGRGSGNGGAAGGSGGGVLLEAPLVSITGAGAGVFANGGGGGCRNAHGSDARDVGAPATGGGCTEAYHGSGGAGGFGTSGAAPGVDAISQATNLFGGGGGGGVGRARINTAAGLYELTGGAAASPPPTTGDVGRK